MNDVYEELELANGEDYLEHHGVLGMHWGVRRYQNADGSLTSAGRKRYNEKYDKWSNKQDQNDADFRKIKEMHKGLGKTGISRTVRAAKNDTKEAKEYNKAYDKWQKKQEELDEEWKDVKASKPKLTDEQKKKIAIAGAAIIGTSLAVYGGVKIAKARKDLIDNGFKALEEKTRMQLHSFEQDLPLDFGPKSLTNLSKQTGLTMKDVLGGVASDKYNIPHPSLDQVQKYAGYQDHSSSVAEVALKRARMAAKAGIQR